MWKAGRDENLISEIVPQTRDYERNHLSSLFNLKQINIHIISYSSSKSYKRDAQHGGFCQKLETIEKLRNSWDCRVRSTTK